MSGPSSASATTVRYAQGDLSVAIQRPAGARVVLQRPGIPQVLETGKQQTFVVLWTEAYKVPHHPGRQRWDSLFAWCQGTVCRAPHRLERRVVKRSELEPVDDVHARLDASLDGSKAFVRVGFNDWARWYMLDRSRKSPVASGPAAAWQPGGEARYVRTASGTDLVTWSNGAAGYIGTPRNGRALGGEIFARPADSVRITRWGSGVAAEWIGRSGTFDDLGPTLSGPAKWSYGASAAELREPTHQVTLASPGLPGGVIASPDGQQQLVVWADGSASPTAHAEWVPAGGVPVPDSALPFAPPTAPSTKFNSIQGFVSLRAQVAADGSLVECASGLRSPGWGGALQAGSAC